MKCMKIATKTIKNNNFNGSLVFCASCARQTADQEYRNSLKGYCPLNPSSSVIVKGLLSS